jgi:hypothetical protein
MPLVASGDPVGCPARLVSSLRRTQRGAHTRMPPVTELHTRQVKRSTKLPAVQLGNNRHGPCHRRSWFLQLRRNGMVTHCTDASRQ